MNPVSGATTTGLCGECWRAQVRHLPYPRRKESPCEEVWGGLGVGAEGTVNCGGCLVHWFPSSQERVFLFFCSVKLLPIYKVLEQ